MGAIGQVSKVFLCFLFFLSGLCKLTPKWGEHVHADMDAAFRERYTPFWQQMFLFSEVGVELDPLAVKVLFGSLEMSCALLLFTRLKFLAAIVLFGLMTQVVLTHVYFGEFEAALMPLVMCVTSLGVSFVGGYEPTGGSRRVKTG